MNLMEKLERKWGRYAVYGLHKYVVGAYFIGFILIAFIKIICSYLYSIEDKLKANLLTLSEAFIFTPLAFIILCPILKLNGVWTGYLFVQMGLLILGIIYSVIIFSEFFISFLLVNNGNNGRDLNSLNSLISLNRIIYLIKSFGLPIFLIILIRLVCEIIYTILNAAQIIIKNEKL